MIHKFVAFDLEITKPIPEGEYILTVGGMTYYADSYYQEGSQVSYTTPDGLVTGFLVPHGMAVEVTRNDWKTHRPLGISCAATRTSGGETRLWHGSLPDGAIFASVMYPARMSPEECQDLAFYLAAMQDGGFRIVTFNGLGFDLDVLQEECGGGEWLDSCRILALDHVDMAFQMLCQKGYMVGLDTMAKGLSLSGKTEGMKGSLAPVMWAESREAQDKTLEYVAQDVKATAEVYESLLEQKKLWWTTKRGRRSRSPWKPIILKDGDDARLLTVAEALMLPEPNTSWMDSPWPRSKFAGWTGDSDVNAA